MPPFPAVTKVAFALVVMIGNHPGEDQNRHGKSIPTLYNAKVRCRSVNGSIGAKVAGVRNGNIYAHTRPMMCEGLHTWRKNSFLAMGSWRLPRVSLIQDIVGLGVSPISMENTNYGDSALNSLCSGFMSRWQRRRPNLVHCHLNLSGHPAAASHAARHDKGFAGHPPGTV